MNIPSYLEKKGYIVKAVGKELISKCPFCKDDNHLYVNPDKEVFYCHKCSEAGNIWKLKRHFGDIAIYTQKQNPKFKAPQEGNDYKYKIQITPEALNFLTKERGFTQSIIDHFNLGFSDDYISIPYYKSGKLVNFKYRHIKDKKFKRDEGCESTLYNIDSIDKSKPIIICEGEFDCISAVQIGFENVISIPTGASGFDESWVDFFDSCLGDIYLSYDNDNVGNEGANKIADKIGKHRCSRVKLPLKDFNDCLMAGFKKDELQKYFDSAESFKLPNLVHVTDVIDRLEDLYGEGESGKGFQLLVWSQWDRCLGGIREAEVTVITGETSSGKTTWGLNILYQLLTKGQSILIASTEMQSIKVMAKLYSMFLEKSFYLISADEFLRATKWFSSKQLFFIDVHGKLSIEDISDYIDYAKRKYDIKFALLDHLHFFIEAGQDNQTAEIEKFMRNLVTICLKTSVHIFIVAHPSKLKNERGIVSMNDIKGSSSIKQDAHNIVTLWRDKDAEKLGNNYVSVDFQKVRDPAGQGGVIRFKFSQDSQLYKELL